MKYQMLYNLPVAGNGFFELCTRYLEHAEWENYQISNHWTFVARITGIDQKKCIKIRKLSYILLWVSWKKVSI